MGRKVDCNRRTPYFACRNLSDCQREYLHEAAAIATIKRGYTVGLSAIVAEIVAEKMRNENYSCAT